ncbi:MAG: hypothetical protein HKN72_17015 [Gemmatimonadetes bacterium]|nr:hypothetical protein [Gemmatimonadota bacterium]NNL31102.1 hypothetical protein [Gemmatimonadota bacterium]
MLRALVTAGFLLVAALVLWASFILGVETSAGTLFINLGTEIVGIVITVAVVEWFFERRRLQNRGRQLAGNALHAVEHAVWVWQGGPRQMETDEVRGILHAVDGDDPVADFTEGLLLNIGTRARRLLSNDPEAVSAVPGFMNGLEHLARLSAIRDGRDRMPSRKVADILDEGTSDLAKALGKPTERHLASLIRFRDPSLTSQERRHFGGNHQSSLGGFRAEPTGFQDD